MTTVEKIVGWVRHRSPLKNARGLWNLVRPGYSAALIWWGRKGIARNINGTDAMKIAPRFRQVSDVYEPEVWPALMRELRPGDVFVDVGAYIGLYAIAVGRRLGRPGAVYAYEPDPNNFAALVEHIAINQLQGVVKPENLAVSSTSGTAYFKFNCGVESRINPAATSGTKVSVVTLQDQFAGRKIDLLKIDVEGFEQAVLEGAVKLLADARLKPRAIYIEMHPFAWPVSGATSAGILSLLHAAGYALFTLDGRPLNEIKEYGEAIARPVA